MIIVGLSLYTKSDISLVEFYSPLLLNDINNDYSPLGHVIAWCNVDSMALSRLFGA